MRFPDNYKVGKDDLTVLYYILLASLVGVIESAIPKPIPFLRLGAANIVIMHLIFNKRYKLALVTTLMKTAVASLLFGRIITPMFPMGMAGALFSYTVMLLFYRTGIFSVYGISMAGGVVHNVIQLGTLSFLLWTVPSMNLLSLAILLGLITGGVNALIYIQLKDKIFPDTPSKSLK
ncbi:Gx transporter family protein [bacterium]|nr:Gx transporter family protein [bacterium]